MKLLLSGTGGIAGDMFAAALISAGASWVNLRSAMLLAANKLGPCSITKNLTQDNSTQLQISLDPTHKHLSGPKAREIIAECFSEMKVTEPYQRFGNLVLSILLEAEKEAHQAFNIVIQDEAAHHSHDHGQTMLHEAQDIVIDIVGAACALMDLGIEPKARLVAPLSVGGGEISFSHGQFKVPAPATQILLDQYAIQYQAGPIEKELCTPTGAALLAALGAGGDLVDIGQADNLRVAGQSRGTRILPIDPLMIYLAP